MRSCWRAISASASAPAGAWPKPAPRAAGNTYGDPAGHSCLAVDGPLQRERLLRTGQSERAANMLAFAAAALELLEQALDDAPR